MIVIHSTVFKIKQIYTAPVSTPPTPKRKILRARLIECVACLNWTVSAIVTGNVTDARSNITSLRKQLPGLLLPLHHQCLRLIVSTVLQRHLKTGERTSDGATSFPMALFPTASHWDVHCRTVRLISTPWRRLGWRYDWDSFAVAFATYDDTVIISWTLQGFKIRLGRTNLMAPTAARRLFRWQDHSLVRQDDACLCTNQDYNSVPNVRIDVVAAKSSLPYHKAFARSAKNIVQIPTRILSRPGFEAGTSPIQTRAGLSKRRPYKHN
jgi:hypothetical protein